MIYFIWPIRSVVNPLCTTVKTPNTQASLPACFDHYQQLWAPTVQLFFYCVRGSCNKEANVIIDIFHPQYYGAIHNSSKHHFFYAQQGILCNFIYFCLALCALSLRTRHCETNFTSYRNPSSEISLCAEGIFFQDSLFCIRCVFSPEMQTWKNSVPLCLFPTQMAFFCCRIISFGLINGAPGPTNLLSIPSFIHLLFFSSESKWEPYTCFYMTYLHATKPNVVVQSNSFPDWFPYRNALLATFHI